MTDHTEESSNNINLTTQPLRSASQLISNTVLVQRFNIIKLLGSGAQGNVYHAYDQLLESDIAIKVVETSLNNQTQLSAIRNEVLIARRLQHQNIIRVYDVFEDQGLIFFTMELIAGESLIKRLEKPILQTEFKLWTQQLFSALTACEASEIKHGDIKPDNILIDEHNNLRLIDFGIGQFHNDELQISGHQDFSAPEVIYSGQSSVQSELYSAGKIIQLMLVNIHHNPLSITQQWWHSKQTSFIALLCHRNRFKRPTLSKANDFYHTQKNSNNLDYRAWLLVVFIILSILVWTLLQQWQQPVTEKKLPATTIQIAIIHDDKTPLLGGLVELFEMPLQTNPQLSVISGYRTHDIIYNLALQPVSVPQDRIRLASIFELDALMMLTIDNIQADDFLIRASIHSMPADISIVELTRSINANTLEQDLAEFTKTLLEKFELQLSQQFEQSEATYFLSGLGALSADLETDRKGTASSINNNLTEFAPEYAGAWYRAADQAWQEGDIQSARHNLQILFTLQSDSIFWLLSGRLLEAEINDDLKLALQAIQKLTEAYPQRSKLLAKRGEIYEWANDYELAIIDYHLATELDPNNAHLWFQLARLKILSGQTQSAIDNELTRALVLYRKNKDLAGEGLVLNAFGVAYIRLAEYNTAEKYLQDSLIIFDPQNFPLERVKSLANLANLDALSGKFIEAQIALEEASQLLEIFGDTTQQAHVLDTLGFLYEEQGLYAQALNYYKKGLDIRTTESAGINQAQSISNVAYMHFLIGDYSLAGIYWQQAKALFNKNNEKLHLQRTLQNIAQLSMAKGEHIKAMRYLADVSQQLDASQKQELMINKLLYSFLNFANGDLTSAIENLSHAKLIAQQTDDSRALTEVYLWHGEICLKTADLRCLKTQIDLVKNSIAGSMVEQQALLNWLIFSYDVEKSELLSSSSIEFMEQIKTANIPVLTRMKILLDMQERVNLPLDSPIMQLLEQIVKPVYYQPYMNLLFLKSSQDAARKLLHEQLIAHPKYWRNHIYYQAFEDEESQLKQKALLQDWMLQLTEQQAKSYRELYLER
ncbi:MAG: serine/threonine protein kinase [Paraglaciecola sp.]|uniref:serine/threonine-protein kinase n=1 Tax=uncultured Paraglaciecola sp. TaxID=1765024 RepID=UPI0025F72428|nr:serine/threonine-protein kinase [uncultured Paraglaciecola sp.]